MDKQLIERIALEVAKDYLKFKLGDRKGLDIYDLDLDDEDLKPLIAEIERECADSFMQFLARIDAERGKVAVATKLATDNPFSCFKVSLADSEKLAALPAGTQLFLSPTIPEGMAKDAARFRWILENPDRAASLLDGIGPSYWCSELDRFIAAAQGEHHAD